MLIDTLTGSQNFPNASAKVYVFASPSRATPAIHEEDHLYAVAQKRLAGIGKHSGGGRMGAVEGLGTEFGTFTQTQYDLPEGAILKLFVQRKTPHAQMGETACQFVRMRAQGALLRIDVPLNDWLQGRVTIRRAYLEGRFDLVDLEEAERLGARVSPIHRRFFNPVTVARLMNVKTLSDQLSAPATVERSIVKNSEGQAVVVESRQSKRALDI